MSPRISVVIPLFNKKSTIARAIDSVLCQTVDDFELIIVDGHSADGSQDIVHTYSDSRIIFFEQEGKGVSAARNQGIDRALSEIVAFLDADDEWKPDFLETILELRREYPSAGLYGTAYSVYQNGNHVLDVVSPTPSQSGLLLSYFGAFVDAGRPIIITSSFASPKDILLEMGGYSEELKIGEDHELFGKIALTYPVAYSQKLCSSYNLASENNTDVVNYLLPVPLQKYLQTKDGYVNIAGIPFLDEYMDYWRLKTAGRNIYSGYRLEGRGMLREIQCSRYSFMKFCFIIASYVPVNWSLLSSGFVRKILRMFRLSI